MKLVLCGIFSLDARTILRIQYTVWSYEDGTVRLRILHFARDNMSAVVEEPPERELEECVLRVFPVLPGRLLLRRIVRRRINRLVAADRIEVRSVCCVPDFWYVQRRLLAETGEVDLCEKRMCLHFLCAGAAKAILGPTAESQDQVARGSREVRLLWNPQTLFPPDDLDTTETVVGK